MTKRTLSFRLTERQVALIDAVAEAEGIEVSELCRRAVFAFVWGSLDLADMPSTERPAVLRLHDFPRIARSLEAAHESDVARMSLPPPRNACPHCDRRLSRRGLAIHIARKHRGDAA